MKKRRSVKKIIIALAMLFFTPAVYASNLSETKQNAFLRWKTRTIPIAFSNSLIKPNLNIKSDSDIKGALNRSLETWENAANVKFESVWSDKQTVSPKGNFGDGVSLITIAQTPENLLMFSRDTDEISARTRIFYNKARNITEADIVLNPYRQFSTDGTFGTFDLETTLTHEIGHLLGLEHSPVIGATMFAGKGKNGVFNLPSFEGRTLGQTDISAVRALYGSYSDDGKCCGVIKGNIEFKNYKLTKSLIVWAQEAESGRITGQTSTQNDGSFSLGGLAFGKYRVFCQKNSSFETSLIGEEIGTVEIKNSKPLILSPKIPLELVNNEPELQISGFNGQLSDLAVPLNSGKTYSIYIGGKNLSPNTVKISFDSPSIKVLPDSLTTLDFGSGISVISCNISIANDISAGEYSIYLDKGGQKELLLGAISIEDYVNPWNSYILNGD